MTRQIQISYNERLRILDGSILPLYNEFVEANYKDKRVIDRLCNFSVYNGDGELTGSTPFGLVCLQNSGLLKDSRIATRQDLETALKFNSDIVSGKCLSFGLTLRTAGDDTINNLLAKNLANQLKAKGIELGKGKLLNFADLTLREDDSYYGLVFDLKENANEFADLSKFKWDSPFSRQGLASPYLGWLGWNSLFDDLGFYSSGSRVAIVEKIK